MSTIIVKNESNLSDRGALMLLEENFKDLQLQDKDRCAVVIGWDEYVVYIRRNVRSTTYKVVDFDKVIKDDNTEDKY